MGTGIVGGRLWRVTLVVPGDWAEAFADRLGDGAAAAAMVEVDPDGAAWLVELTLTDPPDRAALGARVAVLAEACGIMEPDLSIAPIVEADWLSESLASFPPRRIGRFWVFGPHVADPVPPSAIPMEIAAATAFGSGDHGSTRGCLLALQALARRGRRGRRWRGLDCGCGSGILAIAMAKLWRRPVLAVDIDPEAVAVARRNARINGVGSLVQTALADGYAGLTMRRRRPFDCVAANILARPIARMAKHLVMHLRPGGLAVLAGFMVRDEPFVLAAHRRAGMRLRQRVRIDGWSTLVLERRPRGTGEFQRCPPAW